MSILIGLLVLNFIFTLYLAYLIVVKYGIRPKTNDLSPESGTITKINLLRFNPFEDLGGSQSFILVLLDSTDSGVLLTSLHHRNFTRVYAKAIKNGSGENITLSKEEKSAILKTINR